MKEQLKIKVNLTNSNEVEYDLNVNKQEDFYNVVCVLSNEEAGFINFEIKDNKTWIYKIETKENHYHKGVGTALLNAMEYISMLNNTKRVEGKYYPDNKYTKPFYEKYGYFIPNQTKSWDDYDETWTLYKDLDFNKIKEYAENKIKENDIEQETESF